MTTCLQCDNEITSKFSIKFCSPNCGSRYTALNRKQKECKFCNQFFTVNNIQKHEEACSKKRALNRKKVKEFLKYKKGDAFFCPTCAASSKSARGLRNHIFYRHTEEGKQIAKRRGESISKTNKGRVLSIITEEGRRRISQANTGHKHTKEFKECLSKRMKETNLHKLNRSTYFKKKDGTVVYLHSSWEVKVAQDLDAFDVKWIRPKPFRWVDREGVKHFYFPDFYLIDLDIYLDPKNPFLIKKDAEKIARVKQQNNLKLILLDENHLVWFKIKERIQEIYGSVV